MLSVYVHAKQSSWNDVLPFVTSAYNTYRQDTKHLPLALCCTHVIAKFSVDTLLPFVSTPCSDYSDELLARAEETRQMAKT